MTKGLIFWVLMLLWLVLGVWWGRNDFLARNFAPLGGSLLLFVLLLLLGWATFGAPVR